MAGSFWPRGTEIIELSAMKKTTVEDRVVDKAFSFPPNAAKNAEFLVLGSMPGAESLRRQQYYAHPQNQFWRIVGEIFGFSPELTYQEQIGRASCRERV